ncbi:hypothetical protein PG997_004254 [Apiospora hydei]|uniref:Uncharacterized protein n=1 Tax=Apiospora hydei TaxID=1337664 RepID=A0ABR1X1I2_9PEZI
MHKRQTGICSNATKNAHRRNGRLPSPSLLQSVPPSPTLAMATELSETIVVPCSPRPRAGLGSLYDPPSDEAGRQERQPELLTSVRRSRQLKVAATPWNKYIASPTPTPLSSTTAEAWRTDSIPCPVPDWLRHIMASKMVRGNVLFFSN